MEIQRYETILERMKETFRQEAGFEADDASDVGIRLKVLAGEVFSLLHSVDWLRRQVFPQTAQGVLFSPGTLPFSASDLVTVMYSLEI